jgi:hypothetical protein
MIQSINQSETHTSKVLVVTFITLKTIGFASDLIFSITSQLDIVFPIDPARVAVEDSDFGSWTEIVTRAMGFRYNAAAADKVKISDRSVHGCRRVED